ncbi:MAG: Alkaline phosphatase synthesis sensor protein PhoR [Chlamydiia bacterium]|nr:Alkaline phosphatase synthesis sensor protein PhoR [Chlamydiia bacterium]
MNSYLTVFIKSYVLTIFTLILAVFAKDLNIYILSFFAAAFLVVCFLLFRKPQERKMRFHKGDELKPFLQSLDEGVLLVDRSFRMILCNRSIFKMLGIMPSELKRGTFFEIEKSSKKEVLEKSKQLLESCSMSSPEMREVVTYKRGSQSLTTDITIVMINEKEILIILRDVNKGGAMVNLGKDFIANASHELRTPITIIKGFVETLKEMPEISEDMLEDIFDKILRSCIRMDGIVKNLLILTDLDHLSVANMKRFDLLALIDNCRHTLLEVYPKANISIDCSKKEMITKADPDLLELALMNLLTNAVKYSPSPAEISIKLAGEIDERTIEIVDNGYGIPIQSLPSIFNRFYSVDKKMSRKLGGAGLGLSIVKTIIDKHKGEISASENPGGGTTFEVRIPAR